MIEGRKTFGQDLNHLRTERGVSLEELASATKVRAVLLSALEEGRFDELPPAVFVEGYLKACARFLGADPKPWLERYRNLAGVPSSGATLPPVLRVPREEPGGARWLKWAGVFLLLGGLAFASYVLMKQMESSSKVTEPSVPAPRRASETPVVSGEHPAGGAPLSEAQPAVGDPPGDLVLIARDSCWCEIWADGKRALYREVAPGERLGVSGRRFKVNLGNAGAVELHFRGARVTLPVGEGRVVKGLDLPASEETPRP